MQCGETREYSDGVTITTFGKSSPNYLVPQRLLSMSSSNHNGSSAESNLTPQSSSMTSLASTLSDSKNMMMSNSISSETAPVENRTSAIFSPSVLSVSDLESQYDGLDNSTTNGVHNNVSKDPVDFWTSSTSGQSNAEWNRESPVVVIRNTVKSYGSKKSPNVVLDKLNMTIREGSIYGLLGASGCGKTTVLSTIVGLKKIDKGIVSIYGAMPGDRKMGIPGKRVGYMPQELALYGEFTICETLHYFGRIYAMKKVEIDKQIEFLTTLLDLPKCGSLIRKLSGGQQRRVSFAVALLHNPELLILDEPTVGVDPMLRQSIWNHLIRLSTEQKKTILITTHYIEEARQANTVGLMRNGKLLAEDSPLQLLTIYGLETLEQVFLKLCIKDEKDSTTVSSSADQICQKPPLLHSWTGSTRSTLSRKHQNLGVVYPGITACNGDLSIQNLSYCAKNPSQKLPPAEAKAIRQQRILSKAPFEEDDVFETKADKSFFSFNLPTLTVLFALMMKNLIKMMRNFTGLGFVFLLPAIEVVFFCIAIGRDPIQLPLGIVNHEAGGGNLTENCLFESACDFNNLSCRLTSHLDKMDTFNVHFYANEDLAYQATKKAEIWGYVSFHANFSEAFFGRIWSQIDSDKETRKESTTEVYLDMTNQQVAYTMQKKIADGFSNFMSDLLKDCDLPEDMADLPLNFNSPVYGSANPNFTEFMAPGIIIIIIFFLAVALTGEAFIAEKQDGLLDRSWVAGVLPIEVMLSHIFTQFIVLLGQITITLVFVFMVFKIPCNGPVGWIVVIAILQGFAGMCYGFLLSTVFSQQTTAMQCAIGSFYPILLLSGILWPVEGMPKILQKISWYLPCTAACQAMRDIMARGWDISDPSVPIGIGATSVWILIFLLASWTAMKIRTR